MRYALASRNDDLDFSSSRERTFLILGSMFNVVFLLALQVELSGRIPLGFNSSC